jgi:hypothetical protein
MATTDAITFAVDNGHIIMSKQSQRHASNNSLSVPPGSKKLV